MTRDRRAKASATSLKKKSSRKTKVVAAPSVHLLGERWPLDRDILWRPERFKYVRRLLATTGCVFCDARDRGPSQESLVLGVGPYTMAILNKFPYNTGHLLALPKRHCGDLQQLSAEEFDELNNLVRHSLRFLQEAYQCHGFNVGLNLGAAGGAGIPEHLHYHLVPRWAGDANFFPIIAETKVLPETLEQTFRRLIPYYKDMSFLR